jgi:hypothetical protein
MSVQLDPNPRNSILAGKQGRNIPAPLLVLFQPFLDKSRLWTLKAFRTGI